MKTNDTYYQTHKINKQQMNLGTYGYQTLPSFARGTRMETIPWVK